MTKQTIGDSPRDRKNSNADVIGGLIIGAALLYAAFTIAAFAQPGGPVISDEQTKVEALKRAYGLNGDSMVGWGSIDFSREDLSRPPRYAETRGLEPLYPAIQNSFALCAAAQQWPRRVDYPPKWCRVGKQGEQNDL
jgi:hypothetical protein